MIGQFGLGFLSAFLLASEVTLLTRSFQGGPCYKWQSSGDEYYAMEAAWREGRVAVHELPLAESRVDTMFVRRRDAYTSSALAAFLDRARQISAYPVPGRAAAAE